MNAALVKIGTKVSTFAGMAGLKIKAHSPEFFLVTSIVSMTGAVVSGTIAARKHNDILEDHNRRLEIAKAPYIVPEELIGEPYTVDDVDGEIAITGPDGGIVYVPQKTEKEISRAVRKEYCRTAVRFVKLYGLATGLMAVSTFSSIKMHNIQANRFAAVSGAYTALRGYIDRYEQRNIELNGEENHRMCKYGYHEETVEEETANGKKKKVKKLVANDAHDICGVDSEGNYTIAPVFHEQMFEFSKRTTPVYKNNLSLDLMTLDMAETYLNDLIDKRGWAVVNDVLDGLGLERTTEGMVEGWVKGCGPRASLGHRDPINERFLQGWPDEPVILDMNVHDNVFTLLQKLEREKAENKVVDVNA